MAHVTIGLVTAVATPLIRVENVSHHFEAAAGTLPVLQRIFLDVFEGEFLAIVGPSGCGKSTLLNMIAGLVTPLQGRILFDGQPVSKPQTEMGYMTQDETLLPWRTAYGNVVLPLEVRGIDRREAKRQALGWLEKVGLRGFENHFPAQLSGGMRQRLRLARTAVYQPRVMLLDEPFGALDAMTRGQLQNQLMQLMQETRTTTILVTHDLVEAIAMADRVAVFSSRPGRIVGEFEVSIPRPRDVFAIHSAPGFAKVYDQVWALLRSEVFSTR